MQYDCVLLAVTHAVKGVSLKADRTTAHDRTVRTVRSCGRSTLITTGKR